MSHVNWSPWLGNSSYVLDVTTGTGSTQMFLGLGYGAVDPADIGLVPADADGTAAALQTAVNELSGVTDSTLTQFQASASYVLFDASDYANFHFTMSATSEAFGTFSVDSFLVTASPADGVLASGDLDTVTAAIVTYMGGLSGVSDPAVTQETVVPETL